MRKDRCRKRWWMHAKQPGNKLDSSRRPSTTSELHFYHTTFTFLAQRHASSGVAAERRPTRVRVLFMSTRASTYTEPKWHMGLESSSCSGNSVVEKTPHLQPRSSFDVAFGRLRISVNTEASRRATEFPPRLNISTSVLRSAHGSLELQQ